MRRYFYSLALFLFLSMALAGCGGSGDTVIQQIQGPAGQQDGLTAIDQAPPLRGEGWYKGDLHAHSTYSDGDVSVGDVVRIAEEKGLDYFVMTEHMHSETDNVTKSWNDIGYRSNKLTLLIGAEWTTGKGHANVWSNKAFDWQALYEYDKLENAKAAIELAHSYRTENQEVLFSINHPLNSWEYSLEDSADADSMEIWNSVLPMLTFYDSYLKKGKRISAIGGSDTHDHLAEYDKPDDLASNIHNIGWPTTWVYAKTNSAIDILRGIRAGHTAVSISPDGPFIEFTADADSDEFFELMQGDSIPEAALGKEVNFKVMVSCDRKKPTLLTVIKNGAVFKTTWCINDIFYYEFTDSPDAGDYYRVQLGTGLPPIDLIPVAFTGPIYTW